MTEPRRTLTAAELVAGFQKLGLTEGGTAMAHSSLSAFGWVEGGAATVIAALLTALGPTGTLVMPTLCQKDRERRFETWDRERSPSDVGKITEVFRQWPGAVRSDHATHSVAAVGPLAETLTAGHATAGGRPGPWGPAAFGHGSPWQWFYDHKVRYCFLGVTLRVNTLRHFTQSLLVEELLATAAPEVRAGLLDDLAGWNHPGVWPHYDDEAMQDRLAAAGLVTVVSIGEATCRALWARELVDESLAILHRESERWLDAGFVEWQQRVEGRLSQDGQDDGGWTG
jgi:aminoglycoside N3'-acetyltransferase